MATLRLLVLAVVLVIYGVPATQAAATITFRYNHHLYYINPASHPAWSSGTTGYFYNDMQISAKPYSDITENEGWVVNPDWLPEGVEQRELPGWNATAIKATVAAVISDDFNLEPGTVHIKGGPDLDAPITFEGVGLPGRTVNEDVLVQLIIAAIENNKTDITLPVTVVQPNITIDSAELQQRGIKEVVTLGESEFVGSTFKRQHNIRTGLEKFDGTLIEKDSVFSFNKILGPVHGGTGYVKELVIQGERTVPEYGGGLCQVSTTAYRGIWEYGFPIESRRNHSYTVSYYQPQGTDATIYPGVQDMQFTNNSPGDLLIQTYMEGVHAYFIYYGTKDNRESEVVGPYIWGRSAAPPKRVEYVTTLPPGATQNVGNAVAGMSAAWFRVIKEPNATEEVIEPYYSKYQARPYFLLIGKSNEPEPEPVDVASPSDPNNVPVPSWLLGNDDSITADSTTDE